MNIVNEQIKELRSTLQISQRQFAKQIFVSQGLIGEIELGHKKVPESVS
jgi:predicted transcriptional regulator